MFKVKYEIDPHNRLTVLGPNRFRTVLDGTFKLSDGNSLVYRVRKSDNIDTPQQIKFSGNWSLDEEHNLILTLDKWNNQCEGDKLVLKGDLIDANSDELIFSFETKDDGSVRSSAPNNDAQIYILKFSGAWQADQYNRLTFNVEKEKGGSDQLTLQGIWEINKQNEIIYTCTQKNIITLKGYWDISQKNRLSYVLNKDLNSQFDFNVAFERAQNESMSYTIGVGYTPKNKSVTLSGQWKLDKNLGLLFEVAYADGRAERMVFGADCRLADGSLLELKLKNNRGEDLGIEASLDKRIFAGQGEAFIKALASKREIFIGAGVGFKF
jgi:hypothetical protein